MNFLPEIPLVHHGELRLCIYLVLFGFAPSKGIPQDIICSDEQKGQDRAFRNWAKLDNTIEELINFKIQFYCYINEIENEYIFKDTDVLSFVGWERKLKDALDKAGVNTFGGWKEREDGSQVISREMFVTPLIKAVQELSAEVERLKENSHPCKELHEFDAYPDLIKRIEELENK